MLKSVAVIVPAIKLGIFKVPPFNTGLYFIFEFVYIFLFVLLALFSSTKVRKNSASVSITPVPT